MAKELFFSVIIRTENMYGTGGVMFSANKYQCVQVMKMRSNSLLIFVYPILLMFVIIF